MHVRYPNQFLFDQNQNQKVIAIMFETFFRRTTDSLLAVLLIDKGSFLLNRNNIIVDDFIGTLYVLKYDRNGYCLHSFILTDVETIKELLVFRQLSISNISLFKREETIISEHFIKVDIQILFGKYTK